MKTKDLLIIAVLFILTLALLLANASNFQEDKPTIITTFYPVTELTKMIVGDKLKITQLVPSGQEVHDYQIRPSNITDLKSAQLLIKNGSGLEDEWLEDLLKSAGNDNLMILALANSVELIEYSGDKKTLEQGLTTDPHIWLSVKNAALFVEEIAKKIVELDPANRDYYEQNQQQYIEKLRLLDDQINQTVDRFRQNEFIAFHDAFSYFARDYRLNQVAAIELVPGQAPTPGELVHIKELIKRYQISGLFSEPQFSPAIIEQLAKDLNIPTYVLDPIETNYSGTYLEAMNKNLDNLARVLQ